MSTLTDVCVWTLPFPPSGVTVNTTGSPNVVFSTSCLTGNQDISDQAGEMKIFPNPAKDFIYVILPWEGTYTIRITDMTGRLVYSNSTYCSKDLIQVSILSKGVYLVRATEEGGTRKSKLIIQ